MSEQLMKIGEVAAQLAVSKGTIFRWVREGRMAAPLRHGPKYSRFRKSDIDAFMADLIAGQPATTVQPPRPPKTPLVTPPWEGAAA